jgi:hypothetical protein
MRRRPWKSVVEVLLVAGLSVANAELAGRPADKQAEVSPDVVLQWTPDPDVKTFNVYLGRSLSDVNAAEPSDPRGVLVSTGQDANCIFETWFGPWFGTTIIVDFLPEPSPILVEQAIVHSGRQSMKYDYGGYSVGEFLTSHRIGPLTAPIRSRCGTAASRPPSPPFWTVTSS